MQKLIKKQIHWKIRICADAYRGRCIFTTSRKSEITRRQGKATRPMEKNIRDVGHPSYEYIFGRRKVVGCVDYW